MVQTPGPASYTSQQNRIQSDLIIKHAYIYDNGISHMFIVLPDQLLLPFTVLEFFELFPNSVVKKMNKGVNYLI